MGHLDELQGTWNRLGEQNALWAVLSDKKTWDEKAFFETGREEIDTILDTLENTGTRVTFGRALDFGCGVGRLSQALARHFRQVTGVDIADSMVKRAQAFNRRDNVAFRHSTSADLRLFEGRTFNFILSDIVFQHMQNNLAKSYLKEMHRVLKKDGVLVFQLPSEPARTWKGWLIKLLPDSTLTTLRKGMEMNPIKKDELLGYVQGLGFEVITVKRDTNHKHWHAYFYYLKKI